MSGLVTVGENKSGRVGPLSRVFLSAYEWEIGVVVEYAVA